VNGDALWEIWAGGFGKGLRLRPEAWQAVFETEDEQTRVAVHLIALLVAIADGREDETPLEKEEVEELTRVAPEVIPGLVATLAALPKSGSSGAIPAARALKVGRNDPCPCGSGKKFKKCCGLG
jgi:uncharacterized protein